MNKELARFSDGFSNALSMGLENCRQNNATVYALENTFRKITLDFLDMVREDKGWQKGVQPTLKALAKQL